MKANPRLLSIIQRHLTRNWKRILVHYQLSDANKDPRRTCYTSLLTKFCRDPFRSRIVTRVGKWILYDNIKLLKYKLSSNQPSVPTYKPSLYLRKVLLCIWWDCSRIIHFELDRDKQLLLSCITNECI